VLFVPFRGYLFSYNIKITPKANIQKYLSHRPDHLSISVSLVFTTTPYHLIFLRSRAIVEQNAPLISNEEPTFLLYL